jgi:hypothetical protein
MAENPISWKSAKNSDIMHIKLKIRFKMLTVSSMQIRSALKEKGLEKDISLYRFLILNFNLEYLKGLQSS